MAQPDLKLMRFSELKSLCKNHSSSSLIGQAVKKELQRRNNKKHVYKPFKDLNKTIIV